MNEQVHELVEALEHCVKVFRSMSDRGAYPLELLPFTPAGVSDNPYYLGKQGYQFAVEAIANAKGAQS